MAQPPRRLLRALLYTAAAAVITLVLLVGLARLLLPHAPDYQDDIRAWASAATGYDIGFGSISASWPLSGPELSFRDVSLTRPGDPQPVVTAREFSIGLSIFRSLRDWAPQPGRVAVRGSQLQVQRLADGGWLVQGRQLADLLPTPDGASTELDLDLADIAISYADPGRQPREVSLRLRRLTAEVRRQRLAAQIGIDLPAQLGRGLEVELALPLPLPEPLALPAEWEARIAGSGLDLRGMLAYVMGDAGALQAGSGDIEVRAGFHAGRAQQLAVNLNLRDFAVGSPAAAYERLSGRGQWQRVEGGWDAQVLDLRLRRNGRDSPVTVGELHRRQTGEQTQVHWSARAGALRLDDLFPLVRVGLAGTELAARLPQELAGDLHEMVAEFTVGAGEKTRYSVGFGFAGLALGTPAGDVSASGLTGRLAADSEGGRLELDSHDVAITLAQWFRNPLPAQSLQAMLVWRRAPDAVRFISDDIRLKTAAIDINSRLELVFPGDGSSPVLDLSASASATEAPQVLRYLPLRHFPPEVGDWLERAVVAGRVPAAEGVFRGPLHAFPFDHEEGVFRVRLDLEDGILDYADDWPRVEGLDAEVVFDGASLASTRNEARVGKLPVKDFAVHIPDMREGVLSVAGATGLDLGEVLRFLRATPVATHVGPTLERATASGPVDTTMRLALPLTDPAAWNLDLLLDARGCQLALARLPLDLKNVRGRVRLQNTRFSGEGIRAVMLGEPVRVSLVPEAGRGGVAPAQLVKLAGVTPVPRIMSSFSLPLREYLDGSLAWQATVRIPELQESAQAAPLTVAIRSDLRGLSSRLPAPLAKDAATAWPADLGLAFPDHDTIDINAHLEPPLAAALRLVSAAGQWHIERGALHAGPGTVMLPARRGVEVSGQVARLPVNDWLAIGTGGESGHVQGGSSRGFRDIFRHFALDAGQAVIAGQVFPGVQLTAQRGSDAWQVTVRGPNAEGDIVVPFDSAARPLRIDMKRLWLLEEEPGGTGHTDPRGLMAMEVSVEDSALGRWHLGQLELTAVPASDGLVVQRVTTRAPSFQIRGAGSWRVKGGDAAVQETRLQATLESTDVQDTLGQLGLGSAISGKSGRVTMDLAWPGGPSSDFLERASGRLGAELKSGQVTEFEPGSGRLVGLLSVTALPRRLALDFHDVFDKGLSFDEIKGDFSVGGGSAYTCNLGVSSPAVEMAIVGRTDLAGRLYDQMAVVRPQLATTVLTAGGAVLGGPVGGVTMLLISQMFRKSLGSLGESYYRVTGSWDRPEVVRVQGSEVDAAAFRDCEKEIGTALSKSPPAPPASPLQQR